MKEYLDMIFAFVVGGGLTTLINLKYLKRNSKLDFADKAVKFMDHVNDGLLERVGILEDKVKELTEMKCKKADCPDRIK